ncbi:glycosyltransferase family 4 protein [Cytophaga sp. FL35]|uniref:glycosyltransferase family 4 protein n=1 Tax=Cytophaga sp. FL35 TaxID=1904456 RepID=UPI0016536078|nr:glycosyltransferase family 4 protein [Cytophaga sp. FL35]MBC6999408.1 glycosyltransferase family 4 protein [Cytophaga sp. FL35]
MVKKKILFILHIPPPVNGAAIVGQNIMNSSIINKEFEADYINLATSFQLDEIGKGGLNKLKATFKIIRRVFKAIMEKDYDLCYLTLTAKGVGLYKDFLVVVLLKMMNKKIVYHFHNKGVSENKSNKIHDFLYRITFKNTKSILLSPLLYKDVENYVAREDAYFCANGVEDIEDSLFNNTNGLKKEALCKLLFLSNMMAEKGVWTLLQACSMLKAKGLSFECHFIGAWSDVTEKAFTQEVERMDLLTEVFAHGKKYGKDKISFFQDAGIFVFPTFYHNECFPLVLLEAMQFGKPVVSTTEGGIPDIVENGVTGVLVPKRDAQSLAEELEFLILNAERRREMGRAGRLRYEEKFTLKKFEINLKEILNDVITSN